MSLENIKSFVEPKKRFEEWAKQPSIKTQMHYYIEPIMKTLDINDIEAFKDILRDYEQKSDLFIDKDEAGEYFIFLKKQTDSKIIRADI